MHEKLIKQLRINKRCSECPYDEDCNEFDSCLMDLLAADAIEDMSKRIARLEKELQAKDKCIDNEEFLFGKDWQKECVLECKQDIKKLGEMAATQIMISLYQKDRSGELLFHFVNTLSKFSKMVAYAIPNEHRFVVVKEDKYKEICSHHSAK